MKKPVIGARGGAVPEIIVDGDTGLMFTPGDDAELAQEVAGLLEAPDWAKKMGENGYKRAGQDFGIKKNVQKTQQLYERLFS
jgi:glycosyltransferase involved in cell wall biosynthesis